jgi:L-threonylcarbamoyladenylate synthase
LSLFLFHFSATVTTMTERIQINPQIPDAAVLARAAKILRDGGLVAFPTETVYGLGAHALDIAAVRKIFAAKERPSWDPLIIHVGNLAAAVALTRKIPPFFEALTTEFWPGPLTLVVEKSPKVPDEVTSGRKTVAIRMPAHPVAHALLEAANLPIAAPSANKFGRPSPTTAAHVLEDLQNGVDLVLDAGPTTLGVESTVLDLTQNPPKILRPGGVTRENLAKILGEVEVARGVSAEIEREGALAPGMTEKHYAPRAQVELFEANLHDCAARMRSRAEQLQRDGKRVGLITRADDWERFARELFAKLRELDAQKVEVILCELPPAEGIGLAIRDRLLRAAGKSEL